jgi:acyl-CoA synthetase (AMP-forming)/AMP-acid ligase II
VIAGYHDDPAATRKAFRGGWFRTGDLVRALPDGQLVYCGREDHMMIMNGVNIHPAEIERTLCEHPAVADAAAVPLRHPVHQEVPVCAVVLRPGIPVTDRELLAFAERRLGFRGPRGIVVLDEIPRNAQGKLQRDRIIEAVASRANMTGCA